MPCDHHLRCPRALLVASGSVAAVKSLETAKILVASGFSVCVVLTNSAAHFADIRELDTFLNVWQSNHDKPLQDVYCKKLSSSTRDRGIPNAPSFEEGANVFVDADEWSLFTSLKSNDPVLHIALRDWADILIVSPASASFLADAASGRCSDLARSILRAWPGSKPLVLAPAMNTTMWHHPSTLRSLKQIVADRAEMAAVAWASGGTVSSTSFPSLSAPLPRPTALPAAPVSLPPPQLPSSAAERASSPAPTADRPDATAAGAVSAAPVLEAAGVTVVVWPVVKTLACGDTGVGALASPSVIVQAAALACSAAFAPRLPAEAEAVGAQASHAASEVPARYSLARYVDEVGAAAELVVAVDRYGISLPEVRDLHPPIISAAMCK